MCGSQPVRHDVRAVRAIRSAKRGSGQLLWVALAGLGLLGLAARLDGAPPQVTLESPADEGVVNSTSVSFAASATDGTGLYDITLYVGSAPETVTFSGPGRTDDAQVSADQPDTSFGAATAINVDGQTPHAHALIRFPSIFDDAGGPVPRGATILAAALELTCFDPGDLLNLYRLTEDWVEAEVTWNVRSAGLPWTDPGADGPGSNAGVAASGDLTVTGLRSIDITAFVQEWSDGQPNYGLVITDTGLNGVDFDASEGGTPPVLRVTYRSDWQPRETLPLAGTSDSVTFAPVTLADQQDYVWNCLARNTALEEAWAPADFRLRVDTLAPDEPVLVAPPDGATGVSLSPVLEVAVSDPGGDALDVTFYGRAAAGAPEFTIVALPDTQFYSESYPEIFTAQTQWVAGNKTSRNIVFVTHEGDIVQTWNNTTEWERANTSMSLLDSVLPYAVLPGNHDMDVTTRDTSYFNLYFPYTRYEPEAWYGGHYPADGNDSNFELFSAGGEDFIVLHLAFCPPADVLTWADSVLGEYYDRKAIITTHGFLDASGNRNVHACGDTQYIWDALVVPHDNVYFVLCGHVNGEYARMDIVNGRQVHQVLANYQGRTNGGDGWLRTMRFVPAEDKVYVETYSPYLDQYETDANSQFTLDFPMDDFVPIGTDPAVPSGASASAVWPDLAVTTEYEWYAAVTDPTGRSRKSPVWRFTTGTGDTTPPVISSVAAINVTDHGATITWDTDEPADSQVDYGTTTSYGSQVSDAALVTAHVVALSGLASGTLTHYQATSRDSSGNQASSADATFTTLADTTPPAPPGSLAATGGDTTVDLDWADNTEADLAGYSVYRSPVAGGPYTAVATGLSQSMHTDTGLANGTTYYYVVTASDQDGNESAYSAEVSATPADSTPPAAPAALVATGGDGQVALDWADSTEPDLAGYSVYRSLVSGGPYSAVATGLSQSMHTDTGLANGTTYYYVVTASDQSGNESAYSAEAAATPADSTPPAAPANLAAAAGDGVVDLSWNPNGEPDLAGYNVYRGTQPGSHPDKLNASLLGGTSFSDATVTNGTTYFYVVRAADTSGNSSPDSNEASATPTDQTPPAAPAGLAAAAGNGQVTLDWADNPEPDLAGYSVYRSLATGGPYSAVATGLSQSAHTDTGLANGTTYYYVVTASDQSGNESAYSAEAAATPESIALASGEPVLTLGIILSGSYTDTHADDGAVEVWEEDSLKGEKGYDGYYVFDTGLSPPDITAVGLELNAWFDQAGGDPAEAPLVYARNFAAGSWDSLGITVSATQDGTTYAAALEPASHVSSSREVWIRFTDGVRLKGEAKDRLSIDALVLEVAGQADPPPAPPAGLTAVAGDSVVDLAWAANTEPDLAGYNVYRSITSGTGYVKINASLLAGTGYQDLTVANGTTYYYVVRAADLAGGESGDSNEASATPADSIPPAAPLGLTATAGDSVVDLAWTANTEPDLAGYNVYRSTTSGGGYVKINASLVPAPSYVDTAVTNGTTYYYVVAAVDTSGNESASSGEASATPADAPPLSPANLVATAGDQEVSLAWDANSEPDIAGYNVYRSETQGGPYALVNTGGLVTANGYVDSGLTNEVTYYYVVTAVDTDSLESGSSNEAPATPADTTPPAAPAGLTALAGDSVVDLAWTANTESDLAGYKVYRSTTPGGGYAQINASLVAAPAYSDTAVTNGTTYYYVVAAVDGKGNESAFSNEASATPSGGETLHAADIAMALVRKGRNTEGQAMVLVLDGAGAAVEGATVVGDWLLNGADLDSSLAGLTRTDGTVLMKSTPARAGSGDIFTFRITGISKAGYTYDPAANTETEDSISVP